MINKDQIIQKRKKYLLSIYQSLSRADIYYKILGNFPDKIDYISITLFFKITKYITCTEKKSFHALDYNIRDSLYKRIQYLFHILFHILEERYILEINKIIKHLEETYSFI